MSQINITLSLNSQFTKQCTVTMLSCLTNANKGTRYTFYLLTYDLKGSDILFMHTHLDKFDSLQDIIIVRLSKEQYEAIPFVGSFGKETNFRLFIPQLLPHIDKILHLDCDLIVLQDLGQLFNLDIQDKAYAACDEKLKYMWFWNAIKYPYMEKAQKFHNKIGIDIYKQEIHYCNAGVMLINNNYWIQKDYCNRAIKFLNTHKDDPNYLFPDQDAVNWLALQDNIDANCDSRIYLDWKYNISDNIFFECNEKDSLKRKVLARSMGFDTDNLNIKPAIIHYATVPKPWEIKGNNFKIYTMYWDYANQIGWKNEKVSLSKSTKNVKKILKYILPYGIVRYIQKHKL
ncbi:MAG: glycosyltransferase family 8 protein [Firmicutes bacterium]|nr:glycosyltransferase family 8 protein [Bacillota bacterium]MCL1953369.1 glycosyltransferase family 8 protein [Bacillota bacterium]